MAEHTPTPYLPRCCIAHRLEALDVLDTMAFNDVRAAYDEMVAGGWTSLAAIEAIRHEYREWLIDRITAIVNLSCDLLEDEVFT